MKCFFALKKRFSHSFFILMMVTGLTMGIASFAVGNKTAADDCFRDYICGCWTDNVSCRGGCERPRICIMETGVCPKIFTGYISFAALVTALRSVDYRCDCERRKTHEIQNSFFGGFALRGCFVCWLYDQITKHASQSQDNATVFYHSLSGVTF